MAIEPDGRRTSTTYWSPDFTRHADRADWSERDWEDAVLDALRLAVERRLVADVPVGCLLSGGVDSSLIVGLLAEAGQHGLPTFSIGFESVGGVDGDEFQYSDIVAERFATDHHQIRIGTDRMLPALDGAIAAMSEPMVSHDCVAFYLLSQEVAKHVKVVQSGQGADEVFAGYHWYPPMAEPGGQRPRRRGGQPTAAPSSTATPPGSARLVTAERLSPTATRAGAFVAEHFAAPGAETGVDRALRLDTTVMLVDDPVKRVDNMTMAWGLEARVPFLDHELVELAATCPPELKIAHGGKGVLKEAARRVIPAEVIDRPKGYFPVPALTHLEGPYLDLVRDALYAPEAKERGLFRPGGRRRAAGRPQRPAHAAARQRALADRPARAVAAAARHQRGRGVTDQIRHAVPPVTTPRPSPLGSARRVAAASRRRDGRRRRARPRLGPADLRADLRRPGTAGRGAAQEEPGRRDICIYARDPHVLVARRPASCSSTPATPTGCASADDAGRTDADPRVHRAAARRRRRRRRDEPHLRALRHGARAGRRHLGQPPRRRRRQLPGRGPRRRRIGGRHGHRRRPRAAVRRPRGRARACGAWPSTPAAGLPGVGAALDPGAGGDVSATAAAPTWTCRWSTTTPRRSACTRSWASSGCRCWRSSARTRSTSRCSPTRRRPSTTSTPTRGSSPTRPCAAASGWRCSTPRPARCGSRTAAAASSPASRCRSSPPRWR